MPFAVCLACYSYVLFAVHTGKGAVTSLLWQAIFVVVCAFALLVGIWNAYILPKVLEKDGLSEEEIKSWMEDGAPPGGPYAKDEGGHGYQAGGLRYLDPRVRNDTLATNTEFGNAILGLI